MYLHAANPRPLASFKSVALALPLALALGCVSEPSAKPLPGNLLVGAQADNGGIPEAERMTDGLVPVEGDFWDTGITARFGSPEAQITWDLGAKKSIAAALVQGDNNDVYILSVSDDGKTFRPLWQAQPESGAGMRLRQTTLKDSARYVRLTATGGDSLFSVGEVAIFSEAPSGWPNMKITRAEGTTADKVADASASWGISLGVFAAAVVILVLLSRRTRPATQPPAAPETPAPPPAEPPAA
jgi:hypothetical protein